MRFPCRLAFFLVALSAVCTISAQNFVGGVRGIVEDPGGAVISGAAVSLVNTATGTTRSAITNTLGEYAFSQAEPATYSITVESPGFKKLTRPGVIIGTQEFVTLDLKMEIGAVTDTVEVTAETPLVESSNASNGQVISQQQIEDLPNLGRNVFLLSKLSTNVVTAGDPRFNRLQDQSGSSQISVG